jgi:hypothetical protein
MINEETIHAMKPGERIVYFTTNERFGSWAQAVYSLSAYRREYRAVQAIMSKAHSDGLIRFFQKRSPAGEIKYMIERCCCEKPDLHRSL